MIIVIKLLKRCAFKINTISLGAGYIVFSAFNLLTPWCGQDFVFNLHTGHENEK